MKHNHQDHHLHSHHHHEDHHHHGHHHGHHHHVPDTFNLAFALAVGLNFAFTLIEAIYAIAGHSMSLLADAGHNLGDVLGLLFTWGAAWLLTKAANKRFSYGYKRTTILAAILNSLLLVAASAIIAYESISRLLHPGYVNESIIIIVALIGIFINGGTALLFIRGSSDDLNIKSAFLHLAYDALISFGVVITGILILYTGWLWLDPLVGILIVIFILLGTWRLLRDSINLILDAVPHFIDQHAVENFLLKIDGVKAVHDMHIWGLSTKDVALTCHLIMPHRTFTDKDYHDLHEELLHKFKINHSTIQIETNENGNACGHSCN